MPPLSPRPGFRCNACGQPTLAIVRKLELPPDADSDEVQVQLARCGPCGAGAVALYEESRRGAGESWHHRGHPASEATLRTVEEEMAVCATPTDRHCQCSTHLGWAAGGYRRHLGRESFPMELAKGG